MRIIGENENKDIFLGSNNQIVVLTDIEAVAQACETAIELQRSELQYNVAKGIPTSETIWKGVPNQQSFQAYCKEALKAVPGVRIVLSFATEIIDNELVYESAIETEFGPTTVRGIINGSV